MREGRMEKEGKNNKKRNRMIENYANGQRKKKV